MIFQKLALNAALATCFVVPSSLAARDGRVLKSTKKSKSSKSTVEAPIAPSVSPSASVSPSESPTKLELPGPIQVVGYTYTENCDGDRSSTPLSVVSIDPMSAEGEFCLQADSTQGEDTKLSFSSCNSTGNGIEVNVSRHKCKKGSDCMECSSRTDTIYEFPVTFTKEVGCFVDQSLPGWDHDVPVSVNIVPEESAPVFFNILEKHSCLDFSASNDNHISFPPVIKPPTGMPPIFKTPEMAKPNEFLV